MPALFKFEAAREYLFSAVSQIVIAYRDSPLSAGKAGAIHGGDRVPWAKAGHSDNFDTLTTTDWQLHVYGSLRPGLSEWCASRVAMHEFSWEAAHETAGFHKDGLYLIRPDAYVAFAATEQDPQSLERYLAERGLRLTR